MEKEKQEPQYCVDCKYNIVNNCIYYCKINSIKNYIRKKDIYRTCNEIRGVFATLIVNIMSLNKIGLKDYLKYFLKDEKYLCKIPFIVYKTYWYEGVDCKLLDFREWYNNYKLNEL